MFDIVSPINASFIIILNIVEILFILKMKMVKRKKSTVFILNLAISDVVLGLIIIVIKIITFHTKGGPDSQVLLLFNRYLKRSLIQVTLMVSVFTNLVLTTERLLAVKYPHIYRRITKKQRNYTCLVVWICAIGITVAFFFRRGGQLNAYYQQFIILSTIIVVSLPWPIISYTIVRRIIT